MTSHGTHLFSQGLLTWCLKYRAIPMSTESDETESSLPGTIPKARRLDTCSLFFPHKGFRSFLPIAVHCAWGGYGLGQAKCTFLPISVPALLGFVECCKLFTGFWNSHKRQFGPYIVIKLVSLRAWGFLFHHLTYVTPIQIYNKKFCSPLETGLFVDWVLWLCWVYIVLSQYHTSKGNATSSNNRMIIMKYPLSLPTLPYFLSPSRRFWLQSSWDWN